MRAFLPIHAEHPSAGTFSAIVVDVNYTTAVHRLERLSLPWHWRHQPLAKLPKIPMLSVVEAKRAVSSAAFRQAEVIIRITAFLP
jgi:hypothetical protein